VVNSKFKAKVLGMTLLVFSILTGISFAQNTEVKPTVIWNQDGKKMSVAERNNVYCAGYIQNSPINTGFEIVGANEEREQYVYSQGNYIYVNQGASNGIKVGDVYSVIRPRGKVKSRDSGKRQLGTYVEEVGSVEIVRVKDSVSVARIKNSCENFLLGDLLKPWENRTAPAYSQRPALDIFANASGKANGRIVMTRGGGETAARDQIVYIDLGAEDGVQVGDYLTVYRPLGKGGAVNIHRDETMSTQDDDYKSETFKGSDFSIMAPRRAGENAGGKRVTTTDAKKGRPANLRKVVGEMVILNVKERTATALVTRNAQEIHTNDLVEIQ
jgi:hypothetical protein